MDLLKAPIGEIARIVRRGQRELGEVPVARRGEVAQALAGLEREAAEAERRTALLSEDHSGLSARLQPNAQAAAPTAHPLSREHLESLTVRELLPIAGRFPEIKNESRMLKADIISAILNAQEALNV